MKIFFFKLTPFAALHIAYFCGLLGVDALLFVKIKVSNSEILKFTRDFLV